MEKRLVELSGWLIEKAHVERRNAKGNGRVNQMTSSSQRDPPRRGYTVAVEEEGGSWRVLLSRFLAGVPRD